MYRLASINLIEIFEARYVNVDRSKTRTENFNGYSLKFVSRRTIFSGNLIYNNSVSLYSTIV